MALIALALLGWLPIDFEPPAARVEVLLPQLAKQVGHVLIATPELQDDVLVVSARQASPAELLDKIADALEATWDKRGASWSLLRSAEQRKARRERTERDTLAWISRAVSGYGQAGERLPTFDEREAAAIAQAAMLVNPGEPGPSFHLENRLPYQRAAEELVRCLPPSQLASLPLGQRVVFSTKPNAMQRALPEAGAKILATLRDQMGLLATALARQPQFDKDSANLWPFYWMVLPHGRQLDDVLLVVRRDPGQLSLKPVFVDQRGFDLAPGMTTLSLTRYDLSAKPRQDVPDDVVELSPDSKAWVRLYNTPYGALDFNADLGPRIRRCATDDPLGIVFDDGARAMRRATGKSVVLAPADSAFVALAIALRQSKLTVRSFDHLMRLAKMEVEESQGWIVAKQPFPDEVAYERVDRKALEALAKALDRDGAVTLAQAAAFARKQPNGCWNGLLSRLLSRVGPAIGISRDNLPFLRMVGQLPVATQERLIAGGIVKLSDLDSAPRTSIVDGLMNPWYWEGDMTLDNPTSRPEVEDSTAGLEADLTEVLPRGPERAAPMMLTSSEVPIALVKRPEGLINALDPAGVADSIWRSRQSGGDAKLLYKKGLQSRWDLALRVNSKVTKHFYYNETHAEGDWGPYAQLPAAFRRQVDDALRAYAGAEKGDGKPPPP